MAMMMIMIICLEGRILGVVNKDENVNAQHVRLTSNYWRFKRVWINEIMIQSTVIFISANISCNIGIRNA